MRSKRPNFYVLRQPAVTRKRVVSLVSTCLILGAFVSAYATEVGTQNLIELSSAKSVAYKLATGPWVNGAAGNTLAAMPLDLRTAEVPCRIKIDQVGYLQVLPQSEVQVKLTERTLAVTVNKGGLLYGLYEEVKLQASTPGSTITAEAGGSASAESTAENEMFASMGLIRLIPSAEPSFEVSNIKGAAKLVSADTPAVEIAVGQKYRCEGGEIALVQVNPETAVRPATPGQVPSPVVQAAAATVAPAETALAAGVATVAAAQRILIAVLPGATDDDLSQIAPPHQEASPWSPPPRHR